MHKARESRKTFDFSYRSVEILLSVNFNEFFYSQLNKCYPEQYTTYAIRPSS